MKEESLFLQLKKDCTYDDKTRNYTFELSNGKQLSTKRVIYIADPLYKIIFRILFIGNDGEKRLKDLLNAFLFPNENENKIQNLSIITQEYLIENSKLHINFKLADTICKIETTNNKIYIVAIELRINFERTLKKNIIYSDTSKSIISSFDYNYTLLISILSKINYNENNITKTSNNENKNINLIQIIEIDFKKEFKNLKKGKNIFINGKELKTEGKEFIKFFCLGKWAKYKRNRYIIPNIEITKNETLNECFDILSSFSEFEMTKILREEEDFIDYLNSMWEEGFRKGITESSIKLGFIIYLEDKKKSEIAYEIMKNKVKIENENEIREILKNKDTKNVNDFIDYLKKYKLL